MGRKRRRRRQANFGRWVRYNNPVIWWLRRELGNGWARRKFRFLFFGWRRSLHIEGRYDVRAEYEHRLIEPERAIRCRRTILATSATVIAAAISGVGPSDIQIAGVSPIGFPGTLTVSLAIILGQAYCWIVRYTEIAEDGAWEDFDEQGKSATTKLRYVRGADLSKDGHSLIDRSEHDHGGQQKTANWLSNRLAVLGTITTWCIAVWWLWKASGCAGVAAP